MAIVNSYVTNYQREVDLLTKIIVESLSGMILQFVGARVTPPANFPNSGIPFGKLT